jgi:hypothetical protein
MHQSKKNNGKPHLLLAFSWAAACRTLLDHDDGAETNGKKVECWRAGV